LSNKANECVDEERYEVVVEKGAAESI